MTATWTNTGSVGVGRAGREAIFVVADTAAFALVVLATVAVPLTFSIAQADVFALPKTVLTVAFALLVAPLLTVRWIATGRSLAALRSPVAVALVIYLGWTTLATMFAVDRTQAVLGERLQYQGLLASLAYAVFFIGAWATVQTSRRRAALFVAITIGGGFVSIYALMQRAGLDPIWPYLPHGRVFSSIGQANALAAYLVVCLPLALGLWPGRGLPGRLAIALVALMMASALALTLSRGGYLGLLAVVVVLGVASWRGRHVLRIPGRKVGASAVISLALVGLLALVVPSFRGFVEQVTARAVLTGDLTEGSTRGHLDMWTVGIAITADHPVVGTGPDTYVLLFEQYRDQVLSPERAAVMAIFRPESPHNVHIAVAQGAGIPALIAYWALIAAVLVGVQRRLRGHPDPAAYMAGSVMAAAIAGHLVTDAFMTAETTGSMLFWIVLGTSAALAAVPATGVRDAPGLARRGEPAPGPRKAQ